MKTISLTLFLTVIYIFAFSQNKIIDSLSRAFNQPGTDKVKFLISEQLYGQYEELDRDSALFYAEKGLTLANKNGQNLAISYTLASKGYQFTQKGRYGDALQCHLQSIDIFKKSASEEDSWLLYLYDNPDSLKLSIWSRTHQFMAILMSYTQNYEQAIFHLKEVKKTAFIHNNKARLGTADAVLARVYIKLNKLDSALIFAINAEKLRLQAGNKGMLSTVYWYQGDIYSLKGNARQAIQQHKMGIHFGKEFQNLSGLARNYFALTKIYLTTNEKDSSLYYAKKSLETIKILKSAAQEDIDMGRAFENLYMCYRQINQLDSAFKYQGLALVAKDSIYQGRINSLADFQKLSFNEQMRLQELEKEKENYQNQLKQYALFTGLAVFLLIALIYYSNNIKQKKANILLKEQKEKVEKTLSQLKSTQSQLIQSEKMASLGELTAGIAHEIQNPLNFVNNFSEVSVDLAKELKEEVEKPEIDKELIIDLATDLSQNQEKINHHGKRASDIVKGMLEHSRKSTGEKELTDINALCDEYLRLAYHGLRAKDKSFNATMETHFDPNMPKIDIIPQDIGRVLLNVINNACYAVNERSKNAEWADSPLGLPAEQVGAGGKDGKKMESNYIPTVSITTQLIANTQLLIAIKDNGSGIPDTIKDKIFQPFFTTKPTGQGTGLGLSLAYDIVKAHGGELKVQTKEGEGSEFIIQLPIKN